MKPRIKLRRPSHTTVVAYLSLLLVIGGGAAYAAGNLGKNSVGTKQLKKNSVTKAKIKKNAVTSAKIKAGAVTESKIGAGAVNGSKIADGSVTEAELNTASLPFARVVHKARGNTALALTNKPQVYPLDSPTYTQPADRNDGYTGAVDFTMPGTCTPPRVVVAEILVDAPDPTSPKPQDVGAVGTFVDTAGGERSGRVNIGSGGNLDPGRFEPGVVTDRTLSLIVIGSCAAGGGLTATFGGVDVIGAR